MSKLRNYAIKWADEFEWALSIFVGYMLTEYLRDSDAITDYGDWLQGAALGALRLTIVMIAKTYFKLLPDRSPAG